MKKFVASVCKEWKLVTLALFCFALVAYKQFIAPQPPYRWERTYLEVNRVVQMNHRTPKLIHYEDTMIFHPNCILFARDSFPLTGVWHPDQPNVFIPEQSPSNDIYKITIYPNHAVIDRLTGRYGYLTHRYEIPPLDSAVYSTN